MNKFIIVFAFLLFAIMSKMTFSQVQMGALTGVNFTNWKNDTSILDCRSNIGNDFGAFVGYKFKKSKITISLSYLFSRRGPKIITDSTEFKFKNRYHFLKLTASIPMQISEKFDIHFNLGGYVNYWSFSEINYNIGAIDVLYNNLIDKQDNERLMGLSIYKPNLNFGLIFGSGFKFHFDRKNAVFFDFGYEFDLTESGRFYKNNLFGQINRNSEKAFVFYLGYIYTFSTPNILKELFGIKD